MTLGQLGAAGIPAQRIAGTGVGMMRAQSAALRARRAALQTERAEIDALDRLAAQQEAADDLEDW